MGDWLREATLWQRVGRVLPLSWILILVWPVLLLVTSGVPAADLAVSLVALAAFASVWVWFWLQPKTGSEALPSMSVLGALTTLGLALTLSNPRVFHDGLLGYCMVVGAVWPTWRPSLIAVPSVAILIFLAVIGTGSGEITGFGVALVWLFLGFGFVAVQRLLKANLQLELAGKTTSGTSTIVIESLLISPRQTEIMTLVAMGLSDKQIAARLNLSPFTVRSHLQRLYAHHGLHNRAEAAATWIKSKTEAKDEVRTR